MRKKENRTMPAEKLIYPPTVWSYNWPEGDPRHGEVCREVPYDIYLDLVGRPLPYRTCAFAGGPGTGRVVTEITRVDETGAYGYEVENTIRELQEWEVR